MTTTHPYPPATERTARMGEVVMFRSRDGVWTPAVVTQLPEMYDPEEDAAGLGKPGPGMVTVFVMRGSGYTRHRIPREGTKDHLAQAEAESTPLDQLRVWRFTEPTGTT